MCTRIQKYLVIGFIIDPWSFSHSQIIIQPRRLSIWDTFNGIFESISESPSTPPTISPSSFPSNMPSPIPSAIPSQRPSLHHSVSPSSVPTIRPTSDPSSSPSSIPSQFPSISPSAFPTLSPSVLPSTYPSISSSEVPTLHTSNVPSSFPTPVQSSRPSQSQTPSETKQRKPMDTSFSVNVNLLLRELDETMDENEIKTFKETTYNFSSECTSSKLSKKEIETIVIHIRSQRLNKFLEIDLLISGKTTSANPKTIENVLVECFRSKKKDLTDRINISLASSGRVPPNDNFDNFNQMALILMCSGIAAAALMLAVLGTLYIKRRNRKLSSNFQPFDGGLDSLSCEPKIRSFSSLEEKVESTFHDDPTPTNSNKPTYLRQIKEDSDLHIDVVHEMIEDTPIVPNISRLHDLPEEVVEIPKQVDLNTDDGTFSKHTAISSVTDYNQYYKNGQSQNRDVPQNEFGLPPLYVEEHQGEEIRNKSIPNSVRSLKYDSIESTCTSKASSDILMGLNIPMQTAIEAQRLSNDIINKAREDANSPRKESSKENANLSRESMMKALDDICLGRREDVASL